MKLIKNIIVLLFLGQACAGNAQGNIAIDKYLSDVYKTHVVPGFAVVVVHKGRIIYSKGYGVENLYSSKPFTARTVCAVGSLTKSMTTMAMMQLVEQKKVGLDKFVTCYLPWFRTANKELSDKITVRMLLNNTSGLYSNNSSEGYGTTGNALENFVRSLASSFLTRDPGIAYQYSNAGFSVAGLIISKVTGTPYPQYMHDKIFAPLQMLHTSTDPQDFKKLKAIQGHYYGINNAIVAQMENHPQPDGYMPAGSLMYSSAEDLGKYLIALMSTGKNEVISAERRNEMWKQNISFPGVTKEDGGDGSGFGYGLGWMISQIEGRHIIHHGGSTGKMSSFTMIDPQNETAAAILMNVDLSFINKYKYATEINIINNIMRLASGSAASAYGLPTVKDPTLNNYTLNDSLANRYAGSYELKSENVIFLYAGAEMKIIKTTGNKLQCVIYRGEQILNQFTLDFVNEALAVSRSLATPSQVRFKLSPDGNISGLFFIDLEFVRSDEMMASLSKRVFSNNNKLSFMIPKTWTIAWDKNSFTAQSYDGSIQIKGCFNNEVNNPSPENIIHRLLSFSQVRQNGLLHSESFGMYKWKEKAYYCSINNEVKQVITMQSGFAGYNMYFALISREGLLTGDIQHLVTSFLDSIRIRTGNDF